MKSGITNNESPILSIETSSGECGACVYYNNERFYQYYIRYKNIHAEKIFETIDSVIKSAGINSGEIKAIAVSSGPGSFTGLRIGMSAAKGLAYGYSIPLIPVPTFEALALQISKYFPDDSVFAVANKVNIDEVYFAKFKIKSNSYIFVETLKILRFDEFIDISKGIVTFGNAVRDKDNNLLYKNDIFAPEPKFVAEWAVSYGKENIHNTIDYLEPNYLKNFTIKVRKND